MMASLNQLLDHLPHSSWRPTLTNTSLGLSFVEAGNPRFVMPNISEWQAVQPGQTSAILVTAPAAVGKTTVARWIAHEFGAIYWNLAGCHVGQGALAGTIMRSMSPEDAVRTMSEIRAGNLLMVIDALEESEQLSQQPNFEAFLDDLCADLAQFRQNPSILMMTRKEESATSDHLFIHEVAYAHFALEMFNRDQAVEFVDKWLDNTHARSGTLGVAPHKRYAAPFSKARDAIFDKLATCLGGKPKTDPWDTSEGRRILGYAPLLEAVSEYLRDQNAYNQVENEMQAETTNSVWRLLDQIIGRLLRREQEKNKPALNDRFPDVDEIVLSKVFDIGQQLIRISGKILSVDITPHLDLATFPSSNLSQLEEIIETWFANHPFLHGESTEFENKLFEEYFHAWAVSKGPRDIAIETRNRMRRHDYLPNPMFAQFLVMFSTDSNLHTRINVADVGAFYEAYLAEETRNLVIELDISGPDGPNDEAVASGEIVVWTPKPGEENIVFPNEPESFDIVGQGALHIGRRLSNANIDFPGVVELGVTGGSLSLGPVVDMECQTIIWNSEDIRIIVGGDGDFAGDVVICTQECIPAPNVRIKLHGEGILGFRWPNMVHPWIAFRLQEVNDAGQVTEEVADAFHQMCKVIRVFASRSYGGLAKYKHLVHKKVRNSTIGQRVLDCMIADEILKQDHAFYYLQPGALGRLALDRNAISRRQLSPETQNFLEQCL